MWKKTIRKVKKKALPIALNRAAGIETKKRSEVKQENE